MSELTTRISKRLLRPPVDQVLPLSNPSIDAIMAAKPREASHYERIWWPWLLAALLCLVLEILVRKVRLPATWLNYCHAVQQNGKTPSPPTMRW